MLQRLAGPSPDGAPNVFSGGKPMRNLLAFLAVAALAFIGLGWYLDWYKVQSVPGEPGRQSITIDFDRQKIAKDVEKGVQQGEEKLHDVLEKRSSASTAPAGNKPQGN
jgi:hypothetical protein